MWRPASYLIAALGLALAACGGSEGAPDSTIAPGRGAETPVAAVEQLVSALDGANFAEASRLAVPGQAALASLAEGATLGDVARALEEGDGVVAANFWTGFAQETSSFLTPEVSVVDDGTQSELEVEFNLVTVTPPGERPRTMVVREEDGYRVDLFASFGSGLADKMTGPIERLLGTQTGDANLILAELQTIVPSLHVAASLPGTTAEVSQQLISLIEVITRVR